MSGPLRVLIVEDSEDDALLVVRELRKGGYDPVHERVDSPEELAAALHGKTWDIVLSDYSMPRFSGPAALKIVRETDLDIPFIMISGKIGEETAVDAMKAGAHDYVMKDKLKRLIPSVKRELGEAESRRKRRKAEQALLQSESRFFAVFHYSPVPMALGSLDDGRLLDVNKEYLHVTEYSRGGADWPYRHGTQPVVKSRRPRDVDPVSPAEQGHRLGISRLGAYEIRENRGCAVFGRHRHDQRRSASALHGDRRH